MLGHFIFTNAQELYELRWRRCLAAEPVISPEDASPIPLKQYQPQPTRARLRTHAVTNPFRSYACASMNAGLGPGVQ